MSVGKGGAHNAAIFAAQILQSGNASLTKALRAYKKRMAAEVEKKAKKLKKK
jgi:phosphoribosylcarboxyaminoimidazole (NCAIR) mutase